MAGIFAQTVVFGSTITGSSLAEDLQKGDHRPVPVAADVPQRRCSSAGRRPMSSNNVIVLVVMSITGLIVGLADPHLVPRGGSRPTLLLLLFAYAISWVMAVVGLVVRTPEVVNNASFIVIFPLTFIANTFVPIDNFPPVLKCDRGVEPGLLGDPGRAPAVRQPRGRTR